MTLSIGQKRALGWLIFLAMCGLFLWKLDSVLMPFIVSAVLAYALTPLIDWLVLKSKGAIARIWAVVVVEILFIASVACLVLLIFSIVTREIPLLRGQVPMLLDGLHDVLLPLSRRLGFELQLSTANLKKIAMDYLSSNTQEATASLFMSLKMGSGVVVMVLGNLFLIPVILFYFLLDWGRLVARLMGFVPMRMREAVNRFRYEADEILGQYLRGQLMVMLALAVYYSVTLMLFGLDLALPIGVFTGLAVFIPYLGFGLGVVLALIAGLLQFLSVKAFVMVVVVFGVGQIIEGFFLTPRLVGERIGLHPVAVIFALMAFGQLFGFVGVLVALPASAVILVALRHAEQNYKESALYLG